MKKDENKNSEEVEELEKTEELETKNTKGEPYLYISGTKIQGREDCQNFCVNCGASEPVDEVLVVRVLVVRV
jgi:hypothetical protein